MAPAQSHTQQLGHLRGACLYLWWALLSTTFLTSDMVVSSMHVWPFSWTWSSQNQLSTSVGCGQLVGSPSTHRHPHRRAPRSAHLKRTCSTVSWVSLLLMFWLWGLPGRLQRQSRWVTIHGLSWCVPPIPSPSVSQEVKQKKYCMTQPSLSSKEYI